MLPKADKPRLRARPHVSRNAAKLLVFFIAEGIVIAVGVGVLVAVHASDIWWIAWLMLVLFMGSFVGSYLLFPGKIASQPVQPPAERREQEMQAIRGYNLRNIRQLLVDGFSVDELHRLVHYEPSLRAIEATFRPGESALATAYAIIEWSQARAMLGDLLVAAERANPRMYAVHRPYHAEDRGQPACLKTYNLRRISALLEEVFEAGSLYRFCHERASLWPIWKEISEGDSPSQMIYRVLACAERQVLIHDLLMEVKAVYLDAYERFKPYEEGGFEQGDESMAGEGAVG